MVSFTFKIGIPKIFLAYLGFVVSEQYLKQWHGKLEDAGQSPHSLLWAHLYNMLFILPHRPCFSGGNNYQRADHFGFL